MRKNIFGGEKKIEKKLERCFGEFFREEYFWREEKTGVFFFLERISFWKDKKFLGLDQRKCNRKKLEKFLERKNPRSLISGRISGLLRESGVSEMKNSSWFDNMFVSLKHQTERLTRVKKTSFISRIRCRYR